MSVKKVLLGFVVGAAMAGFSALPVFAEMLPTVTFEGFATGPVNGQFGWKSLGAVGLGCAVYDHAVTATGLPSAFGARSLRISNAATSGCFDDNTFAAPLTDSVGEADSTNGTFSPGTMQRHFEMQFDFGSAVPGALQPGMVMSMSPDRGDGSRMSYLRFEDQSDGIHVIFDDVRGTSDPANFVDTQIGVLDRSTTHTIKLTFDALDGPSNDIVKVWIDGIHKITGTSWENYYRYDHEANAEQSPRIVKTVIFRTGGDPVSANHDHGFLFDNLSLSSGRAPSENTDQCKKGGWQTLGGFKNQGDCVSYVQSSPNAIGNRK